MSVESIFLEQIRIEQTIVDQYQCKRVAIDPSNYCDVIEIPIRKFKFNFCRENWTSPHMTGSPYGLRRIDPK
jgi:hypothetical protein